MRILRHFAATLALWVLVAVPAKAAGLIRNADVEYALAQIAAPVLRADGEPANPRGAAIEPDGWHGYDTLNNSFGYLCESPAP